MDREELPDAIPDRPVLLCAEPECDRAPAVGDRRCALHAARLGSLPGRPPTPAPEAVALAVAPDRTPARAGAPRPRTAYRVGRVVAWVASLGALPLFADPGLFGESILPFIILPLCWLSSVVGLMTMLATAPRLRDPWLLPPLLATLLWVVRMLG